MSAALDFRVRTVANRLSGFRWMFGSEDALQAAIADVLTEAGEVVSRENILDRRNRADLMLADALLVEVKVDGSLSEALRQCDRYSKLPAVKAIVLASTCSWARRALVSRPRMGGKPFALVFLPRQAL
jgi:hypothetical protein